MRETRVLMVGSARESAGGVSSVIKLMEKMPVWDKYHCYWLGTQVQSNMWIKIKYALIAYIKVIFIIWKYDIIHFHTTPDRGGLMVQMPILILAKLFKKKVILHVHMGNQLKEHTDNKFFIWYLQKSDAIILLANKWKSLFHSLFPTIIKPIYVVYNACESLEDFSFEKKEKIIVLMSHMIKDKGIDIMLAAWQMLCREYDDWHVFMMGKGEYLKYEKKAHEMGLSDTMTFTSYVTGTKKRELLQKASISVMCSYNEGFPMVVLEGWSYKHAVVTTPVGGLPDVIENGRNCLVFDFGDAKMLAEQLKLLMDNRSLRESIASYSKAFGENTFSLENVSKSLEKVYNTI